MKQKKNPAAPPRGRVATFDLYTKIKAWLGLGFHDIAFILGITPSQLSLLTKYSGKKPKIADRVLKRLRELNTLRNFWATQSKQAIPTDALRFHAASGNSLMQLLAWGGVGDEEAKEMLRSLAQRQRGQRIESDKSVWQVLREQPCPGGPPTMT